MTPIDKILPRVTQLGQVAGQFYCAVFNEIVPTLGIERAEIQAYLLTKASIEAVLRIEQNTNHVNDAVLTQVLAQFNPKAGC